MDASLTTQLQHVLAPTSQQALQVEVIWALLIAAGLLLVGAFLGTTIGFIIAGRDMKHARHEATKMREMRDLAETAHSLALTEREHAVSELQEKQTQLDEAQLNLQQQSEDLQHKLTASEQTQGEQLATITYLQTELAETQATLNDARARVTDADNATAEMQAALQSMETLLQAQRTRLAFTMPGNGTEAAASAIITRDQRLEQMQTQLDTILQRLPSAPAPYTSSFDKAVAAAPEPDTLGLSVSDDEFRLEDIKGIGASYAARLRANGITSVTKLAAANSDQLAGIVKAPIFTKPNYAAWISTAQRLIKK